MPGVVAYKPFKETVDFKISSNVDSIQKVGNTYISNLSKVECIPEFRFYRNLEYCFELFGEKAVICKIEIMGNVINRGKYFYTNAYKIIERIDGNYKAAGNKYVFLDGILHSSTEPARIKGKCITWFYNGVPHRQGGPAFVCTEKGKERWIRHGKLHREDGPAVITTNIKIWYYHGVPHRIDGPAIERVDGTKAWYFHGRLHRTDGPAFIRADGSEEWYMHGSLHRSGGPAVFRSEQYSAWYCLGYLHRDDGPAVDVFPGIQNLHSWYYDGIISRRYSGIISRRHSEYFTSIKRNDSRILERTSLQTDTGDAKLWYRNGKLHREDGPAIVKPGCSIWYQNNVRLNIDGPIQEEVDEKGEMIRQCLHDAAGRSKHKLKPMSIIEPCAVASSSDSASAQAALPRKKNKRCLIS